MKRKLLTAAAIVSALGCAALYYPFFVAWKPALYLLSVVLAGVSAGALAALFSKKKPLFAGLAVGAGFAAGFLLLNLLINNLILKSVNAKLAGILAAALLFAAFVLLYVLLSRGRQAKRGMAALAFALAAAVCVCSMLEQTILPAFYQKTYRRVASPTGGAAPEKEAVSLLTDADFYVSPKGSDENPGTFDSPFLTPERARDAVRAMDKTGKTQITVAFHAGEYRVDGLTFSAEDSGTPDCPVVYTACGDGEAVFNGGVTLPYDAFAPVTEEETLARLAPDVRDKVLAVDLGAMGITPEQYGKIYAIGGYHTAAHYTGDWVGDIYCELFADDIRQTIARYPNGRDYLYTGKVVREGEGRESASAVVKDNNFEELQNPAPDVYKMDKALSDRIRGWKTLDDVWMFGYWRYDWADASTPVGEVDHKNLTISPKFVSTYGAAAGKPYYFFNVLEELDAPGEWYLDRARAILYFYPPETVTADSSISLSLTTDNLIRAEADYLTFAGITLKGTRGDAVSITGEGNTVRDCLIKNVAGNALLLTGKNNLALDNEITRTGKGGVILSGGDNETLAPGNNRAENNLVHDWSEIYETYQPAFTLNGVGNVCAHNEIFNAPHEAVTYAGCNHLIEYNLIHDVNLLTDDGGAIYSGRRWDWYGNVIRYNLIYDLGKDGHEPVGIYMDDAIAGQSIYGNIIVNAPSIGIQLGGGRDLDVHDNIIVNSRRAMTYDDRALSGLSGDERNSFYHHYKQNGSVWQLLYASPWQSEAWQNAFPQYKRYSDDFTDTGNPDFVLNPAYSTVTHNLILSPDGSIGEISDAAYRYSAIEDNAVLRLNRLKDVFVDPENGDYTLREDAPIGFRLDVPQMDAIGRQ